MNQKDEPHYIGHKDRLKKKFLASDSSSFSDYELLELLLFQAIPRRDVKPLAKALLKQFGNFNNLINASKEKLLSIEDKNNKILLQFKIVKEILNRIFTNHIKDTNIISSWGELINYLQFNMGTLGIEQFRVLFLNKSNRLIADEVMASGTVDQTPVYPREIIKAALLHEATAIILVHNHPSENTNPSQADIDLTSKIANACKSISVTLHDHVIIGFDGYFSFKSNLLL